MVTFLLGVLALECLVMLGWGMLRRARMIEFPFLASAVFFGWVLPQLIGLRNHRFLPTGGLEKTILMAILCLAAAWWGYRRNRRPARLFRWHLSPSRLLWGSTVTSLVGAFFFYQMSQIAPEAGTQWSGIITIYAFFAGLLAVGTAIVLILFLHRPSWTTALLLGFDLMFYLHRIIMSGRRTAMVELGLMVLLALWFRRRWLPPRWAMVAALFLGILVVNSIGDYRTTVIRADQRGWSGAGIGDIMAIDYFGNLHNLISGEAGNPELTNAVMNIEGVDRQMKFDFGFSYWNALIERYVPGQFIGADRKQALMIDFAGIDPVSTSAVTEFGFIPVTGSTPTGLSDSFQSFWYFGAMIFYIIGLVMSRWYRAAIRGNVIAQITVLLIVTPSLHAITHSTHWFFVYFVQLAAFLLPVVFLARIRKPLKPTSDTPRVALAYRRFPGQA